MKKLGFLAMSIAMAAFTFIACNPEQNNNNQDVDKIVEDGFYVVGPATAVESIDAENAALGLMGSGINEATKETRAGLYEKYVALEGGKEFELVLKEAKEITHYGASIELGDPYDVDGGVNIKVYKGELKQNVKMTVPENGFYHIALDLNTKGDLPAASIIVAPVEWSINANSDKVLKASDFNKTSMTWTFEGLELKKGSKYKYAYGGGWKIKVTPAQEVNIETNLGEGMKSGAADILITKSGVYNFKLVWNLAGGQIEKNFVDETVCAQEIEEKAPEHLYFIGEHCGWDWAKAAEMPKITVNDQFGDDIFWTIKYIKANEGFKFSTTNAWDGNDFTKLVGELVGAKEGTEDPNKGNLIVDADGMYFIAVDYTHDKVTVQPARVFGQGDAFGGWNGDVAFELQGDKFVGEATNDGNLRIFADADVMDGIDWWRREFLVSEGKIVYRSTNDDFDKWDPAIVVPVTAGQKITLDFNAETGTIQ